MDKLADTVKERAAAQLDSQKGRATDGLDVIAHAVRQTTHQLRSDQHETIAQYIDRAADQLERLSASIREKNVNDLVQDAQQLARRQPALFIGGSFAVGLLAARFLKSSSRDGGQASDVTDERHDYGTTTGGSPGYQSAGHTPADFDTRTDTPASGRTIERYERERS